MPDTPMANEKEEHEMSEQKTLAAQPHSPPATITPMEMLQRAVDRGADLDMLNKLMDLQERWEKNEARKAFVAALGEFKAEPPTIKKNKKTDFTSKRTGDKTEYDYLSLPEAVRLIAPALSEHGLSHTWSVAQTDNRVSVTCTLTHRMGHSESVTLTAPADDSGSKNSIQAIGSTVTYLQRYSLLAITGLAASDLDDDGISGDDDILTADQVQNLENLVAEVGADRKKFLSWLNVEEMSDLHPKHYDAALKALESKRRMKDAG